MFKRVIIVGTGLIGASVALALRGSGFAGAITGVDKDAGGRESARLRGAFDDVVDGGEARFEEAELVVLATPVLGILDWMTELAPRLVEGQLVTDVGSTKLEVCRLAEQDFNRAGRARFLPGHPMAGKELGGAGRAEAELFHGAMWLFTPLAGEGALEAEWRGMVARFGARSMDMDAARHDRLCAWVSHLPQMLSTALAALLEEEIGGLPEMGAIGGRALRETTRLGASPYSMWRDVAMTNTEAVAETLLRLEQRLAHMRENLRTPELREEFRLANAFRARG